MTIKVGDTLPNVPVKYLGAEGIAATSTEELFSGKKAVMFAVPGAFTPTCSAKHLPGFVEHADAFKAKGVEVIVCMAVNDPFVMKAWNDKDGGDGVFMLPDGNAELTKAIGLEMDGSGVALGLRSQRFAMVLDDMKVSHLAVDGPGNFEVTAAEAVLAVL